MSKRIPRAVAGCCSALVLAAASGSARADSSGMDWLAVAYVWGANISADVADRGVGLSFSDIVDSLDMALMAHVEAQGEEFGGFVDVVYMGISDSASRPLAEVRSELDMTLMDLAVVWNPAAERFSGLEAYGGLRYIASDVGLRVEVTPLPQPVVIRTGIDKSFTDFLVGGRYAARINDTWRLVFSGDLSAGDTEGTWSLAGYSAYRNGPHRFYAGYRHLEAEIKAGAAKSVDMSFSGPVIGYGFAF